MLGKRLQRLRQLQNKSMSAKHGVTEMEKSIISPELSVEYGSPASTTPQLVPKIMRKRLE